MTHDKLLDKIEAIDYWQEHFANRTFLKALRAVVEMHKPKMYEGRVSNYLICTGCYEEEGQNYDYPCPTIQAIEKELNV